MAYFILGPDAPIFTRCFPRVTESLTCKEGYIRVRQVEVRQSELVHRCIRLAIGGKELSSKYMYSYCFNFSVVFQLLTLILYTTSHILNTGPLLDVVIEYYTVVLLLLCK